MTRSLRLPTLLVVAAAAALVACDAEAPGAADVACQPACDGRECGPDQCGGRCGDCTPGSACGADGRCAPEPNACDASCADLGLVCGEHCGESCGLCVGSLARCELGQCLCEPACSLPVCAQEDGCAGVCPPCPSDAGCADCPLRLHVIAVERNAERIVGVTLGLDFAPPEGAPLPRAADLRLVAEGPARLVEVTVGTPILDAGKSLVPDTATGEAWSVLGDGTLRFVVLSTANDDTIAGGRWLELRVLFTPEALQTALPLVARLVVRSETLTPPNADALLFGGDHGGPVVVWPLQPDG